MRGIDSRLAAIERHVAVSAPAPCPICGDDPRSTAAHRFIISDGHAPRDTRVGEGRCPGCGRVTWFTILFDSVRGEEREALGACEKPGVPIGAG